VSKLSELLQATNDAWPGGPLPVRKRAELSRKHGKLDFTTVAKYQRGAHPERPDELTLKKLAEAYRLPLSKLQEAAGVGVGAGPYQPPEEASRLTRRQQDAITELIMAIAADKGDTGVGDTEQKTSKAADGRTADAGSAAAPTGARGGWTEDQEQTRPTKRRAKKGRRIA
jgi:hypothetical protein